MNEIRLKTCQEIIALIDDYMETMDRSSLYQHKMGNDSRYFEAKTLASGAWWVKTQILNLIKKETQE